MKPASLLLVIALTLFSCTQPRWIRNSASLPKNGTFIIGRGISKDGNFTEAINLARQDAVTKLARERGIENPNPSNFNMREVCTSPYSHVGFVNEVFVLYQVITQGSDSVLFSIKCQSSFAFIHNIKIKSHLEPLKRRNEELWLENRTLTNELRKLKSKDDINKKTILEKETCQKKQSQRELTTKKTSELYKITSTLINSAYNNGINQDALKAIILNASDLEDSLYKDYFAEPDPITALVLIRFYEAVISLQPSLKVFNEEQIQSKIKLLKQKS